MSWQTATPAANSSGSHIPANRTPKERIESLVTASIKDDIDDERCVVETYRTTSEQKQALIDLLETCPRDHIPLEWVIDIADETNGWFYGTAYHYDDTTNMLHVMVPDKQNPTFDGPVYLDHRTVHLVECVDGKTEALFNKIIRENIIRVKWEVDWFEEDATPSVTPVKGSGPQQNGRWIASAVRYYLRIANQLLVEDEDFGESDSRGFVMLTADMNVRLKFCHKGKGQEDFDRLVTDCCVLSTPDVLEAAKKSLKDMMGDRPGSTAGPAGGTAEKEVSVRKLADMSRSLKECVSEILDEREKVATYRVKMAKSFKQFVMEGDLDAGLRLLVDADEVHAKQAKKLEALAASQEGDEVADEKDSFELAADDAWIIANKLERGTIKLLRQGGDGSQSADEVTFLRQTQKKMKADMDAMERELQQLRMGKVGGI